MGNIKVAHPFYNAYNGLNTNCYDLWDVPLYKLCLHVHFTAGIILLTIIKIFPLLHQFVHTRVKAGRMFVFTYDWFRAGRKLTGNPT